MAKVDWITWKTDPSEIINPKIVEEKIDELFRNYYNYMKPYVYDEIKKEILKGGLSEEAYVVSNSSPLNNSAIEILDKISEIEETFENLKSSVSSTLLEQKQIEKVQLKNSINDKIKSEMELKKHIENNDNIKSNISLLGNHPDEIVSIIDDRLNRLNNKLNVIDNL